MKYTLDASQCKNFEISSRKEWLLTNGLGGYAMGSVSGANTRRYHGHLVASVVPPATRMVLLANLEADIQGEGNPIGISCNQYQGAIHPEGYQYLEQFAVGKTALWRYRAGGMVIEKQLAVHQGQNATTIRYVNRGQKPIRLLLRPLVSHKYYHGQFRVTDGYPSELQFLGDSTVIQHDGLPLIISHKDAQRTETAGWYYRFEHMREVERGLDPRDDLFCPCELTYELDAGNSAMLVCSALAEVKPFDNWEDEPSGTNIGDALRDAAQKFFVQTEARTSIIAGYPWFTDWGRDTMISLPGLCLCTGRIAEAKQIILDYASQLRNGLIPNRFVERGEEPEYNTVDATLWFVNAIYQTLVAEWDEKFARRCHKTLLRVFESHMNGTDFGIGMDSSDGLLTQGQAGVQLTWMDAKVGDWVVTPRHGKPVEINGLWVNGLRVMEWLCDRLGEESAKYKNAAEKAERSFESKFWKPTLGYYLDTVDPDDASLRPNQLIAMSLPFGPAKGENAKLAFERISRDLLTPVGLRTLSPDSSDYHPRFKGPLSDLDSAYHQGTVWPWLMGPYVSALVKLTGDRVEARRLLKPAREMLQEHGLGGISEVYDGDEPRQPNGCPWQAWSVAEWLRAWTEDAGAK